MTTDRRASILAQLDDTKFDLVVIGGGITGAGILREAALRGLSVALLEAADFASGTSSKSTKLIHGGLRYLAMGHFGLVAEAARERVRVNRLAPHLAEPNWLMLPAANRLEMMKFRIGVSLYERLGLVDRSHEHYNLHGPALKEAEPLLNTDAFPHACVYREYLTEDARLVQANIRAGTRAGGVAANYTKVTGFIKNGEHVEGVVATCQLTGAEITVRAAAVINAAGPWIEQLADLDGTPNPKAMMLSKGVHLVIPRSTLPIQQMLFLTAKDGRPVFTIARDDVVYVGTTDSEYLGRPGSWPPVTRDEITYLLEPLGRYFGCYLQPEDCLGSWAGLRPLIKEPGRGSRELSRKDEIWVSASGLVTIAGGKLTGYRKMASDTLARTFELLARPLPGETADEPLPGGDFDGDIPKLARQIAQVVPLPDSTCTRLASLYGTEAIDIVKLSSGSVGASDKVLAGEIMWAVREEGAQTLEDVLYRRTRTPLYEPQASFSLLAGAAAIMAAELSWDATRIEAEIAGMRARLADDLSFQDDAQGQDAAA